MDTATMFTPDHSIPLSSFYSQRFSCWILSQTTERVIPEGEGGGRWVRMEGSPPRYFFKPARTRTIKEAALSRLYIFALNLVGMLQKQ